MITEGQLKDCRKEFEEFFKSLKTESPESKGRVEDVRMHSLRVASLSQLLIRSVNGNTDEKNENGVAEIVALFHDLGRAVMIIEGQESPTNIQRDHAARSVTLLEKLESFRSLDEVARLTIQKVIDSHNKYKLPRLDNEQQVNFAQILRDADKLDIFDLSYKYFKERAGIQPIVTFDLVNHPDVSEKILKSIAAGKAAMYEDMKTMNDYKLLLMSMVYDLNFKYAFRITSEKQYIQKIYETLPKRDPIIDAYRGIKLFVENKFVFTGN